MPTDTGPERSRGDGEAAGAARQEAGQGNGRTPHEGVDQLLNAMTQSVAQATEAIRFLNRTITELKPLLATIREFEDAVQAMGLDGSGLLALMAPEEPARRALKAGTPTPGALTPAERDFARALRVLTGERDGDRTPRAASGERQVTARATAPAAEADQEPPVDGQAVDAPGEEGEDLARGTYARETVQAVRHRLTITAGRGDVDLIALHRALSRLSGVDEVMLRGFGDGRAVVELATRETESGSELDARIVDALREEFDIVFKRGGELVVQASSRNGADEDERQEEESA